MAARKSSPDWSDFGVQPSSSGRSCGVWRLLEAIPEQHRERVRLLIEGLEHDAEAVTQALESKAAGQVRIPGVHVIRTHRRKRCRCYRKDQQ